jgi:hypothetical protein
MPKGQAEFSTFLLLFVLFRYAEADPADPDQWREELMARQRTATEAVRTLERGAVEQALEASRISGSMKDFYSVVGMRNPSRSYFVRYAGRLHSLKAVVTHALRRRQPLVSSRDFHAGDAADRLRELQFDVVHNVGDADTAREREWLLRLERSGQAEFSSKLIDLYGRCALSGCTTLAALEAAHVKTVAAGGLDHSANGILLRADLHKLFDANLIAVDPRTGRVGVSSECAEDYAAHLADAVFTAPPGGPQLSDFQERWSKFSEE